MADGATSVVKVGGKTCKPFLLQVMVFSPESGYKFEVSVERACTPDNDEIWKLVFDLYKQKPGEDGFDQIVHVSFRAGTDQETEGVKTIAANGVSQQQADILVNDVYDTAKGLEAVPAPTQGDKEALHDAMSRVTTVDVEV